MDNSEKIYKEISSRYAEIYGETLRREMLELERQNVLYVTPRMDQRIKRLAGKRKTRRYIRGFSALAAGLFLIIMLPVLMSQRSGFAPRSEAPQALSSAMDNAAPEAAPEFEAAEDMAEEPMGEALMDGGAPQTAAGSAIMPLAFTLPDNFSVADSKLDNGKSVYYLADTGLDDVVLTMQADSPELYGGFTELTINDSPAYALSTPDYKLLAFQKDGVAYELSCKYELQTLVTLGSTIL